MTQSKDPNTDTYRIFDNEYNLPINEDFSPSKQKNLMEATILFARNGYNATSVRDIAKHLGVKESAMYNHFASKHDLWLSILDHTASLYKLYFEELDHQMDKASDAREVIDLIFEEPKQMRNVFTNYAFSMILSERVHDPDANRLYHELFTEYSVGMIKKWLDKYIAHGEIDYADTKTVAFTIMQGVLCSINTWVAVDMGRTVSPDESSYLEKLEKLILKTLGIE